MNRWIATTVLLLSTGLAAANPAPPKSAICMGCHAVDTPMVGPSFKQIAAKYAKDKKAPDTLAQKIIKGGTGVWGNGVMPPNNLTPDEAKKLAQWVLATK